MSYTEHMAKKPIVVGNWKMELSHKAALELVRALKKLLRGVDIIGDVVVCPSHVSLPEVADMLKRLESISVGAQNVHWEEKGAWTGEVSVVQLKPFVEWCIVGHSEQRAITGETDEQVLQKANLLVHHGIAPIVCVGESAQERDDDKTVERIESFMQVFLPNMDRSSLTKLVMCYEPIWAISSHREDPMPDPQGISEIAMLMRKLVAREYDQDIAERLLVIYGGSVNRQNASDYVQEPGIDGALVGGGSLHPREFVEIIKNVQETWE